MVKVVSVINLKGGVGKTTTTIQLAECLTSQYGKKVLVIDLDPQTNATILLINEFKWERLHLSNDTLCHLFEDKIKNTQKFNLSRALQKSVSNLRLPQLDLLASSINLIEIQDEISKCTAPTEIIKNTVEPILKNYDYVLIDCPPNLGYITQNGIEISDYYLIPTIPDALSTYGMKLVISKIDKIKKARNLKIRCLGLVITKYDVRSTSHKRGVDDLPIKFKKSFDALGIPSAPVFKIKMPQANATAEAMDVKNSQTSFTGKYGTSKSGDYYLYQWVTKLTQEFIQYAV